MAASRTTGENRYRLRRPCARCPFRTDVPGYLRRARASEIARAIADGAEFACHATTVLEGDGDDGEEELVDDPSSSAQCAGALIVMEKAEAPNQAARMAENLGFYDPSRLALDAPVFDSLAAFVLHHGEDEPEVEQECCGVCDPGCLAPAGYMIGGHAVPVEPEGDVHECPTCGDAVCDECSDDDGVCKTCAEYE